MDDDLYVVDHIDQYRSICVSTLARNTVEDAEITHMGGDRGYFIYEVDKRLVGGGIQILAKAVSVEAAERLVSLWQGARSMPQPA